MRSNRSNNHHAKFARAEERWHDEELRDDPPRRGWRKRLTVLTLIAIGIYAYRTYYVEPGSTQARPGIIAEERPSKVIPAASDRQSGKLVQDRVGALGSGERMVSPEEQPVEPKSSTLHSAWPLPPAPSQPPPQGTASAPDNTSGDPKRVATLPIRPDGTEATGRRASQPPSASASAAPSPARPAQRAAPAAPLSLNPPAPADDGERAPATQRALTPPAPRTAAIPSPASRGEGCGRWIFRAGVFATERSQRAGVLALAAGEVPQRTRRPGRHHSTRRSWRQRDLLPRHDGAVRVGR